MSHAHAETRIDLSADLAEFFDQAITDAVDQCGCETSEASRYYLVTLLADYAKPTALTGRAMHRPLTFALHEALHKVGLERFEHLRSLGDTVLYTRSFFADHLTNRGVALDYVSSLGARAYDHASAMLRRGSTDVSADVFGELADNFSDCVVLVSHVADQLYARSATSDTAMLKVYERWLRTGSSALAEGLARRGVMPVSNDGTVH